GVALEADIAAVGAAGRLATTDDDSLDDGPFLDVGAGDHALDAAHHDVSQPRGATVGAAKDLNAHHFLGARVVGHVEPSLHLDHDSTTWSLFAGPGGRGPRSSPKQVLVLRELSDRFDLRLGAGTGGGAHSGHVHPLVLGHDADQLPTLGSAARAGFDNLDRVAQRRIVVFVMHMANRAATQV